MEAVVSTGGVSLAVHHLGGEGERLLLAHANGFHARVFEPMAAALGDRYMLCSDGLSDVVDEAEIEAALRDFADPQSAADELVRLALEGGGPDNVTVVVGDVREHRQLKRWPWIAAAVAAVLAAAALALGLALRN